jgi:1-acyl-sn-glycerol-3-phosphate acyltransferase
MDRRLMARSHRTRQWSVDPLFQPDRLYWLIHDTPAFLWRRFSTLVTQGFENFPESPFIMVSNHESVLDPLLIGSSIPRPIHSMAKSTQFASPLMRRIMTHCFAYPVRRYRVDPQAVRTTLRRLRDGHSIHIYPEGERTWDGTLQHFRAGTIRLILKAGVPVVPCAIAGAYEAWPRWNRGIQLPPVCVRVGPPMTFPQLDSRDERAAAFNETEQQIVAAISRERDAAHATLSHIPANR